MRACAGIVCALLPSETPSKINKIKTMNMELLSASLPGRLREDGKDLADEAPETGWCASALSAVIARISNLSFRAGQLGTRYILVSNGQEATSFILENKYGQGLRTKTENYGPRGMARERIHKASCGEARARRSQRDGPAKIDGVVRFPGRCSGGELQSSGGNSEPLLARVNDEPLAAQETDER